MGGFAQSTAAGVSAVLSHPYEAIEDSGGSIYIADAGNNRILKIANGALVLVAGGNPSGAYAGDNGPAASASLKGPQAIALDLQGNLFVSDTLNNRIRKITTTGTIVTVAGIGFAGFTGDGGPAASAAIYYPTGLATDSAGDLFFADDLNQRIRRISPSGIITTVAGTGIAGFSGDQGPATSAQLNYPEGVAVDPSENLYIADNHNHRIRKVSSDGAISTVAGNGAAGFSGDSGPATGASLNSPTRVAIDRNGNLLIADTGNHRIRRIDAQTGIITTLAGTGVAGYSGDTGAATQAELNTPHSVFEDAGGRVLIAEYGNNLIRTVAPDGTIGTLSLSTLKNVTTGTVRMIYLVPSDATPQASYANGMERAIRNLQIFYRNQMGDGSTFQLHTPVVETYTLPHPASWYQTQGPFWDTVMADAFQLTGGKFNDPNNRWVYYIQENQACNQQGAVSGGTSGVALMPLDDLRGVSGQKAVQVCPTDVIPSDWLCRWIGGLGHELGHAFNLPHPPECQNPQPGVACEYNALMWTGYSTYPNAILLAPDKASLSASGFFSPVDLPADLPSCLSSPLPAAPVLTVSPQSLSFTYTAGTIPSPQAITATSSGAPFLVWIQSSGKLPALSQIATTPVAVPITPSYTVPGVYNDGIDIFTAGASNGSQHVPVTVTVLPTAAPAGAPVITGITNSAGGQAAISPGSFVSIYGTNLAPVSDDWSNSIVGGKLPSQIDGVSVTIGGKPAYIYQMVPTQINAQVPDVAPGPVAVTVTTPTGTSAVFAANLQEYTPAFWSWPGNQPVATHSDYTIAAKNGTFPATTTVPARPGEVITLWGTGFGPVIPAVPAGMVPGNAGAPTFGPVSVTLNGAPVSVLGAALSPYPGDYQVAIQIPVAMPNGDYPVSATAGGVTATPLTLTVQQ